MEQLIIFIIMLVLGSLFGKKTKEPPKRTERPPAPQPKQGQKTFKDLSKDIFQEIQKEFQEMQKDLQPQEAPQPEKLPKIEIPQQPEPVAKPVPKAVQRPERPSTDRSRQGSAARERVIAQQKSDDPFEIGKEELLPTDQRELLKGIIFSEILGPPKSKQ